MSHAARAPHTRYAPLAESDLGAILALHLASTGAVGRADLIKPESPDFFARILNGGGRVIGAWRDGVFVGYGVLQLDLPPSEDARPYFGLSAHDSLAKLAGACVLPHAWGGGVHDRLIARRIEEARRLGVAHLYATAAPGNARSWENLIAAGFAVRGLVEKYGGHLRYLLHRSEGTTAPSTGGGAWLDTADAPAQRALIEKGWTARRWRRREDGGRDLFYEASA